MYQNSLILLHSERPQLHTTLDFLSAIGLKEEKFIRYTYSLSRWDLPAAYH